MKISIVTPSFNQAAYIEEAIESVLSQRCDALEYVIMDGGSTDGSVDIIRRHEARLAHWTSGKDGGHYAAVNAGFARTSGDVMAWLNADDKYLPWTFSVVAEVFEQLPEVEWITTRFPLRWDRRGRAVRCSPREGYAREAFQRGAYRPGEGREVIQQESTFWRRSLWERAGGLDPAYALAGDFELWARFFQHAELVSVETPLGGFRLHGDQRSAEHRAQYFAEAERAWLAHGGSAPGPLARFTKSPAKICRFNKNTEAWELETVRV